MFALVPSSADSRIAKVVQKRALFRLPRYWLFVLLGLVAMIAVTSPIAAAADAPPSAAPNSTPALSVPSAAPAAIPEAAPPSSAPPVIAWPAAPQPAAPSVATLDLTPPQPAEPQKQSITRTWWFWTAIGAAVVAGAVAIYFVERTPSPPGCPTAMGYVCPR